MSYSYTNLKNYIDGETKNKSDSVSPSLRTVVNDAVREEITDFDYRSLQRHTRTFRAVFSDVFKYPLPADMSDESLIDVQRFDKQSQPSGINYRKVDQRKWYSNKEYGTFAFEYDKGLKWLVGSLGEDAPEVLHTMDSLTENGTWAAADSGTAITVNETNFISGDGAIQITNSGTANSIVNSTLTQLDISGTTYAFVWVYLPTTTNLTNITILYGSSASAYYTSVVTSPFNTDSFIDGWNLVGFSRSSETTTGSPDATAIDYCKITANYSSASTDTILFDQVFFVTGKGYDLVYGSLFGWRTTAGVWQETSTSDSDLINADAEEFKVFAKRCAYEVAKRIPLEENEIERIRRDYLEARTNYRQKFPSMRKRTKSSY